MAPESNSSYPEQIPYLQLRSLPGLKLYHFANTREGWYDFRLQASGQRLLFETELSGDATKVENDIFNLQYFFVRIELHLRENRENRPDYLLLIHVPDKDDLNRAATYLSMQEKYFPNLHIYTTEEPIQTTAPDSICRKLKPADDYLKLLPLLRIHQDRLPYAALEDPRGGLSSDDVKELSQTPDKKQDPADPKPTDSGGPDEKSAEERELLTICRELIRKLFQQLKGTQEHKMDSDEKAAAIKALGSYFEKWFDQINLMTQLLWMFSLYTLNQEKKLSFAQTENLPPEELLFSELEKSFAYAKSFSDGILQIIENSCIHTDAKSAYLSIRLHQVDLSVSESNLMDVLRTRRRLANRYTSDGGKSGFEAIPKSRMELLDGIPYYLEINAIDDASYLDPETGKPRLRGITEVFLANHGGAPSVQTLRDVFRYYPILREEEQDAFARSEEGMGQMLDQLTCHYGLHVIQKMVTTNRGICAVRTPFKDPGDAADTGNDQSECYAIFPEQTIPKSQRQTADAENHRIRERGFQYQRCRGRMRGTEYQLLLPMSSQIMAGSYEEKSSVPTPVDLLDTGVLRWKSPVRQTSICLEALLSRSPLEDDAFYDAGAKKALAAKFETMLQEEFQRLGANWDAGGYEIYLLDIGQIRGLRLELLTKGLFRYIARTDQRRDQLPSGEKRMLIALYFSDEMQMQAFAQMYSIFYSVDGRNDFMQGVQLALCQSSPETGLPEISTVLMGRDIRSARRTAEAFMYHHSESSLRVLPFLSYLTRSETAGAKAEDEEAVEIFPFDLYLRESPGDASGVREEDGSRISPDLDCWFLRKMVRIAQQKLREVGYGCMIPDIHVRLGSKMHIEAFFEAELLFQNIGNIARFAFLATRQICSGYLSPERPVFLVAYEDYSSILVRYVQKYLSAVLERPEAVDYALFTNQPEGRLCPSTHLNGLSPQEQLEFLNGAEVVTLLPVGTTLSTIYTMRSSVAELLVKLRDQADAGEPAGEERDLLGGERNIVIVLVADSRQEALVEQYWRRQKERIETPGGKETIILTSPDGKNTAKARYFLQVHADWHNHLDCIDDDGKSKVLVYVDTTSTVPNMIFPLLDSPSKGTAAFLRTDTAFPERFDYLDGCITYGHIKNGDNHFLYDIDLAKFCVQAEAPTSRAARSHVTVSQWLDALRKKSSFVESGAFNIVVSPLDMENAPFLHLAAEHLFSHSIRFLRIPIRDSRTDDIRAKFSFISRECQEIRRKNIPINVYYVDNSIVTGNTFQRGRKLIQMLLQDAGEHRADTEVFRGVLLLLNRSRMDTASSMVDKPETYYQAYLHLAIPHYNTVQGLCPGCRFQQRNQRMAESCSSNLLADEFCRLSEKYRLYGREEYEAAQRSALRRSETAFRQLCQWLYTAPERKKNEPEIARAREIACGIRRRTVRAFLRDQGIDCDQNELSALADCLKAKGQAFKDAYLQAMSSAGLREYLEEDPGREQDVLCLETVWLRHVLNERAMLRAYCTHQAYCLLESEAIFENGTISGEKILDCLYQLIEGKQKLPASLSSIAPDEQRISYLKILSREYLANYYDIREQIADLMVHLLYALLGLEAKQRDRDALSGEGYPLLRYHLLLTLYQQLANLQVNVVLKKDILNAVNGKIAQLRQKYFRSLDRDRDQFLLCPMIPDGGQHIQFAKCIKWLSLSNDEENNCFLIQRELPLLGGSR